LCFRSIPGSSLIGGREARYPNFLSGDPMNKLLSVAAVAALFVSVATPAAAEGFTGPRVGVNVGFADDDFGGTDAFTYGVNAGYDFDLGSAVVGGTVEYQESSEDFYGRDISVTGRVGGKVAPNVLLYGLAGYTNFNVEGTGVDLDGVRLGAGAEALFGEHVYGNLEYRYSNYERDVDGHQMLLGLGFRF
jgi:outer membrane immunogenic protein